MDKDENTFAPLPEHARKILDAAQEKIAKFEAQQRRAEEEHEAYKDGYAYGVKHGFDKLVDPKVDLNLYPDSQDLRIEWGRGYEHCRANALLGHDVTALLEQDLFWIHDEGAIVVELSQKIAKLERLCLDCEHCWMLSAVPAYSELTPGHGIEFRCSKNKWEFNEFRVSRTGLKSFLETARECTDFEEA